MVYVFLADGFEQIEAMAPIDLLRRSEIDVRTVGIGSQAIKSASNVTILTDIDDNQIELNNDLEMIVLPGGMPGTLNLEKNSNVLKAIDFCIKNNKYIAAICAAPSILGHKGILNGIECTCYPGFETQLNDAKYINKEVCVDKKFITSKGPGTSIQFGIKLVEILKGKNSANKLGEAIQWQTV